MLFERNASSKLHTNTHTHTYCVMQTERDATWDASSWSEIERAFRTGCLTMIMCHSVVETSRQFPDECCVHFRVRLTYVHEIACCMWHYFIYIYFVAKLWLRGICRVQKSKPKCEMEKVSQHISRWSHYAENNAIAEWWNKMHILCVLSNCT